MPSRQNKDADNTQAIPMGEEKAFEFFFRQYYPTLCFFANSIIHNEDEAKDIVQDCFVILWSNQTANERSETVKSFLYTIVRNKAIDHLRKKKTIKRAAAELTIAQNDSPFEYFEEVVFAELIRELGERIEALPTKVQEILKLYYIDGKKHHEIATAMNSTPEAVRKQKARALKIIRGKFPFLYCWF
jgi:RNA polymerase sigma-70 factor (family 1)